MVFHSKVADVLRHCSTQRAGTGLMVWSIESRSVYL
jgi:hypothetical protein